MELFGGSQTTRHQIFPGLVYRPVRRDAGEIRSGHRDRHHAKSGAGFAGFAVWFDMTPAHPDLLAMADASSVIQLPWKPEVGWVTADLRWTASSRIKLRASAQTRGPACGAKRYELKSGVECEFFLITPDGKAIADAADRRPSPATTSSR